MPRFKRKPSTKKHDAKQITVPVESKGVVGREAEVIALLKTDMTLPEIGEKFGVTGTSIWDFNKRRKIRPTKKRKLGTDRQIANAVKKLKQKNYFGKLVQLKVGKGGMNPITFLNRLNYANSLGIEKPSVRLLLLKKGEFKKAVKNLAAEKPGVKEQIYGQEIVKYLSGFLDKKGLNAFLKQVQQKGKAVGVKNHFQFYYKYLVQMDLLFQKELGRHMGADDFWLVLKANMNAAREVVARRKKYSLLSNEVSSMLSERGLAIQGVQKMLASRLTKIKGRVIEYELLTGKTYAPSTYYLTADAAKWRKFLGKTMRETPEAIQHMPRAEKRQPRANLVQIFFREAMQSLLPIQQTALSASVKKIKPEYRSRIFRLLATSKTRAAEKTQLLDSIAKLNSDPEKQTEANYSFLRMFNHIK